MNNRSVALDACRGVAVLAVLAYHLKEFGFYPSLPAPFTIWPACGMFGVDLFYVLSGFFITQAIIRPKTWQQGVFLRARISRIYPAYLFSLFIVVAARIGEGAVAISPNLITNILLHVTMLHNFFGVGGSLNGVYWTLGVEFPYYLLMLVLAPFLRNSRLFWFVSLTMLGISLLWRAGVFLYIPEINRAYVSTQLPGALDAFALGGIATLLNQSTSLTKILHRWRWPLFATSIVGLVFSLHYYSIHAGDYWSDGWSVIVWRSGLAACCALLILACAKMHYSKILAYSSLPWFGKISFSLYLYHLLPILVINHYLVDQAWPLKLLLATTSTLLISWTSWRFIEMHFHLTLAQKGEK